MSHKLFASTIAAQSSRVCLQCAWEFGVGRRFLVSVNLDLKLKSFWCNHCWEWISINLWCYFVWADTFWWQVWCRLLSIFISYHLGDTWLCLPWHRDSLCRTEAQLHVQLQFQGIGPELPRAGISSVIFKCCGKSKVQSVSFEDFSKWWCFNQPSKVWKEENYRSKTESEALHWIIILAAVCALCRCFQLNVT